MIYVTCEEFEIIFLLKIAHVQVRIGYARYSK